MIKSKFGATIATMCTSIGSTILLMAFSIVYNQILINVYGSSINGLISTITQFVSLFSIVEGGATTAAVVAIYEPYIRNETQKINDTIFTVKKYFSRIALAFGFISLIGGVIYLEFVGSPLSMVDTLLLLAITILSTMISIGINSKYIVLLSGSNKSYIVNLVYMISKALAWSLTIVLMVNECNILLVYFVHGLNTIFDWIFLRSFVSRYYTNYSFQGSYNPKLLKGTKDVLFQKIASTVFSSTDLTIISAFISFEIASVYNTYNIIFTAVNSLLSAISVSPMNSFGHLLSGDRSNADNLFSIYQKLVQLSASVFLVSLGGTIIPFLRLYTKRVTDTNYIIPSLVFLFFTYYYLKLSNAPFGMVLNVTGHFKQQNVQCGLSAIFNIALSLAFINNWGIQGVVLGSVCGTAIILFGNMYQSLIVLKAMQVGKSLFSLVFNYIIGVIVIRFFIMFDYVATSYFAWIGYGIVSFLIVLLIFLATNFVEDRDTMSLTIRFVKNKLLGLFRV